MFDCRLAVGFVKDNEAARNADVFAVLPEYAHANTVKSSHIRHKPAIIGVFAQQMSHPLAHLLGSLIGKSNGQDVIRRGLVGSYKISDAMRQCLGFAGPGTSLNKQRPFRSFNGAALLRIQTLQELV